ncbi:hypothetical protein EHS14_05600 [Schaalia georgiae]|nr:hypothetical protein EHS14_05600 [Schaalia georgiae]
MPERPPERGRAPGATAGGSDHLSAHTFPRAGKMVIHVSLTRTRVLRWDCGKGSTSPSAPDGTVQEPSTAMPILAPGG